jgi:5'-3' exonuclease
MIEFEADDALASAATKYASEPLVEQVVICSPDKDLMQCVEGERVVCRDRLRERLYDERGVVEKFGIEPRLVPDYLALVGDSADGIPGVARWGAKSAAALLGRYPGLQQIPHSEQDWDIKVRGAPALAASLRASFEDALLYRTLATLRRDVPLPESVEQLRWRGVNAPLLEQMAQILDAPRLVGQFSQEGAV